MLVLKILVALAAVGLGIWLGLPGRYDQTLEDLERNMELGRGSQKVQRHFTPLAWVQRKVAARGQHRKPRHAFRMERPEDR
jgi:hypothetical protein